MVARLSASKPLSSSAVSNSLIQFLSELYGSVGLARQKLKIIEFNSQKNALIVQCALESVSDVMAAVVLWNKVESEPLKAELVFKSGSLKRNRKKAGLQAKSKPSF